LAANQAKEIQAHLTNIKTIRRKGQEDKSKLELQVEMLQSKLAQKTNRQAEEQQQDEENVSQVRALQEDVQTLVTSNDELQKQLEMQHEHI